MTITIFLAKYLIFFSPLILLFHIYKKINTNNGCHSNFYDSSHLDNSKKKCEDNGVNNCKKIKTQFTEMLLVGVSGIFSWLVASNFLKNIFQLERPNPENFFIEPDTFYSFPSGHTTFWIALATALYSYDKKLGIIIFILGLIVGFSRVMVGLHFYRDIFGGIIFGLILGFVFIKILRKYF